jgi:rRNA maturation protein Nop10
MKLHFCPVHENKVYTLKSSCPSCSRPTKDAHYKFIKLKDADTKHYEKRLSSRAAQEKVEMLT